MIQLRFVPIDKWPQKRTRSRKETPFFSGYVKTLDQLEKELNHLHAKDIVLQAFISWDEIRNDGILKANARFGDPGVILTFQSDNGPLSFPCDTFTHWQANLRGIVLSLEALRAVNRYGVTRRAEQYQGWKQIAPPSDRPFATKEDAAKFIATHGVQDPEHFPMDRPERLVTDRPYMIEMYRRAASKLHPDKPGGSHELFVRLQAALRMLEGAA
jgi:hypothetical protein